MKRILFAALTATTMLVAVPAHAVPSAPSRQPAAKPLQGLVISLDPGHQLGNSNPKYASKINHMRFNGYIMKQCNTTGTATNQGYPEATFTWKVANKLKSKLEALGASVVMTRSTNSWSDWGPCTWIRGAYGGEHDADFAVSIHGNGESARARGFFIMSPGKIKGYTDDIYKQSYTLAKSMMNGMVAAGAEKANYIDPIVVWKDQTTLNFSDVPTVLIELGNMRNRHDAKRMSSNAGQQRYASWLLGGIIRYVKSQA